MADDNDGAESVLSSGWLSPRTLLHKTTKFVLNAAHGKTRSLIPTSDIGTVAETGVVDWIEEAEEDVADAKEEVEQTMVVPERDVLMGRWSEYVAASGEGRSPTPPGMMRLSRSVPPRRRTAYKVPQLSSHTIEPKRRPHHGRTVFTMLPVRVVGRIMEFLPIDTMLVVANICRIVRRAVHLHGPGTQGMAGDQAYTSVGLHMWRVRVQQMGWRLWRERQRGRERRLRVRVPQSHAMLLEHICGVKDEAGILELLASEPDLVFKALYDNMIGDYTAFSTMNGCIPQVVRDVDGKRSAAAVAERLDQLLWFARGRFTNSADVTNMRLVSAADRFEAEYQAQFKHAFMQGDCERMQGCARVLEHIRDGRSCIRILVDAHPLFSSAPPAPYAAVLANSDRVSDAHTFGAVLSELDSLIAEHARVVHAGLPGKVLQMSAVYCFVYELFDAKRSGVALRALQNMYAHLRSMPVAGQDVGTEQRRDVVPDEATKDIVYLSTVASIVSLLLDAADKWSRMEPVSLPRELGQRCVFSAFEDVIDEYVQLERRVIERAYEGELAQWATKVRNEAMRDSASVPESIDTSSHKGESLRLVNFRLRQQQMEEYKDRVLLLVQDKLQIMDAATAGDGSRRRSSASQKEMPRRTVVGDVLGHAPVSIDLCLNMVLTNRDTIDRLAVFASAPSDMRLRDQAQDAIESVFCVLLRSIGNHVRPAYARIVAELKELEHSVMVTMQTDQSALAQLEQQTRSSFIRAELRFFELIHLCDLCVQILEIYFKSFMTAFIDEHDFLNTCNQERKALERAVDDSVAVGMDCVIEIIMRQTQHIVDTEQHRADYSPSSNVSLTLTPTVACTRAVQFLGESTVVLQSMTGHRQMRTVFLGEIGVRLFYVLLEHIKRFRITEPGGFQLIADLNLYYDWASENVDPETLRYFTALKDLANCFILAPRDLRGFLQDQYSRRTFDGVMRSEEVYDVVACRSDYRNIRTQVEGHCDFM
ncbi:F-box protein: endocytic membrane traffic, recycling ReCYcling 1 [Coemansia sp. RSA 1822]|nr:F-box protein: endocytic membrane traffic, recycling ReCYcling 1 [Coemansia sp. RSA 638]KAJ2539976.1 F-box protein: endocytic membrane traffic, recycling ReCYcling 1 [Coemansia sp. RSA 1853]KAJ2564817.1 F-box protein: endocytic membrane traffic, recycling ReCYcling 1 [Coemansia sp. RSA 1822]